MSIITRSDKGSALTYAEMDSNFRQLGGTSIDSAGYILVTTGDGVAAYKKATDSSVTQTFNKVLIKNSGGTTLATLLAE